MYKPQEEVVQDVKPDEFPFYQNENVVADEPEEVVGSLENSDTLSGFKLSRAEAPEPNTVIPLNASGRFPTSAVPGAGQIVSSFTGAVLTTSTAFPIDDTIPQNTEGREVATVSITPTSATSLLLIVGTVSMSNNNAGYTCGVGLFVDTTADALAAAFSGDGSAEREQNITVYHVVTAGSTTARTYKLRAGSGNTGVTTINGAAGGRFFGGVASSGIFVVEFKV